MVQFCLDANRKNMLTTEIRGKRCDSSRREPLDAFESPHSLNSGSKELWQLCGNSKTLAFVKIMSTAG